VCDTFVALPDATLGGELIFGKNSDRPGGEVQDVVAFPAQQFAAGDTAPCSFAPISAPHLTLRLPA